MVFVFAMYMMLSVCYAYDLRMLNRVCVLQGMYVVVVSVVSVLCLCL